ncbi:MAG TPA: hypothetical protein VNT55_19740, partial [Baekduia sp.]|nr:hypothetical protein [Baekduia sp.]
RVVVSCSARCRVTPKLTGKAGTRSISVGAKPRTVAAGDQGTFTLSLPRALRRARTTVTIAVTADPADGGARATRTARLRL